MASTAAPSISKCSRPEPCPTTWPPSPLDAGAHLPADTRQGRGIVARVRAPTQDEHIPIRQQKGDCVAGGRRTGTERGCIETNGGPFADSGVSEVGRRTPQMPRLAGIWCAGMGGDPVAHAPWVIAADL